MTFLYPLTWGRTRIKCTSKGGGCGSVTKPFHAVPEAAQPACGGLGRLGGWPGAGTSLTPGRRGPAQLYR
ncbi:MAG: hypothetical protein C4302_08740, partial [Thermus sp.]